MQIFSKYGICIYLYIHNKYTHSTHIYYAKQPFILDVINRLTALYYIMYALFCTASQSQRLFSPQSTYWTLKRRFS